MKNILMQSQLKRILLTTILLLAGTILLYTIVERNTFLPGQDEDSSEEARVESLAIIPREITMPTIAVSAEIVPVGVDQDGNMAVPEELLEVGWYEPGFKPGEMGSAVFAGHVNSRFGLPTIFQNLEDIQLEDTFSITGEDGQELVFRVVAKNTYDFRTAPLEEIYGPHDEPTINLITCDDDLWLGEEGTYKDRLVVTAVLVSPGTDE
jgi:sortase (surface protein transpeptidase)